MENVKENWVRNNYRMRNIWNVDEWKLKLKGILFG